MGDVRSNGVEDGRCWFPSIGVALQTALPYVSHEEPPPACEIVAQICVASTVELCAAAAAADRMSASRRRLFRDVFTSCCTPAICC